MKDNYKKIALWQTAFLGDAVLTLPFIKALSLRFPEAEIHLFVRKGVEPLFESQKELTAVHGFAKRGNQKGMGAAFRLGRELGAQGFDLWISAHTSMRSAIVSRATGIPERIGYDQPWFNRFAYTHRVMRRFDKFEEVERLMALGLPLGISGTAPSFELNLSESALEDASAFFDKISDTPVIGFHPGSTWETKKWPEQNFASTIAKSLDAGFRVILFGGPGEEDICSRIAEQSGNPSEIINLAGKLSLPQLATYIKNLDVYITNDSGPMHIAWVQNVPLIALFGPTVRRFGFFPRGEYSSVLESGEVLDCRPCGLHGGSKCPKNNHKCMTDISVEMVWEELLKKVEIRRSGC
ncbi:heptosyltransferase-2 [Maridesulfovibrio ferrireducens]|uniref:lipopolysaccharide heptosyltransferase II n=1 Tax=Maridesulfovibrio ferrireducens TaxID=246191 RepID=A0A1G9CUN8_9BACT|nr:lipopolysaccharide heptosyltransferase II [Maridesulfovibrio ferrireducens]SDK55372.1 heptosyltransferase-2 [Maridesulfovibrio ferrireducens]